MANSRQKAAHLTVSYVFGNKTLSDVAEDGEAYETTVGIIVGVPLTLLVLLAGLVVLILYWRRSGSCPCRRTGLLRAPCCCISANNTPVQDALPPPPIEVPQIPEPSDAADPSPRPPPLNPKRRAQQSATNSAYQPSPSQGSPTLSVEGGESSQVPLPPSRQQAWVSWEDDAEGIHQLSPAPAPAYRSDVVEDFVDKSFGQKKQGKEKRSQTRYFASHEDLARGAGRQEGGGDEGAGPWGSSLWGGREGAGPRESPVELRPMGGPGTSGGYDALLHQVTQDLHPDVVNVIPLDEGLPTSDSEGSSPRPVTPENADV